MEKLNLKQECVIKKLKSHQFNHLTHSTADPAMLHMEFSQGGTLNIQYTGNGEVIFNNLANQMLSNLCKRHGLDYDKICSELKECA